MANFGKVLQGIGAGLSGAGETLINYQVQKERNDIARGYLDQQRKELVQQEKRHNDQMLYQYHLPKAMDSLTEVTEASARGNNKLADELWMNSSSFINSTFNKLGLGAPSLNLIKARGEEAYQSQLTLNNFFSNMMSSNKEVNPEEVNNALMAMRKLGIDEAKAFNAINPLVESQRNRIKELSSGFVFNGKELPKDAVKPAIDAGLVATGESVGGKIQLGKAPAKIDPAEIKRLQDLYNLPPATAAKIANARDAVSMNSKVVKEYNQLLQNDKDVGLLTTLVDQARGKLTGKREQDRATLAQAIGKSNLAYVKAMAGTTFTDRLLDHMSNINPSDKLSPETFRSMLSSTIASGWADAANAMKDPEITGNKLNPQVVKDLLKDNADSIIFDSANIFSPETLLDMLDKAQYTEEELRKFVGKLPASTKQRLKEANDAR